MRKRITMLISALICISLPLAGCAKTYGSPEDLIEKVREESSAAETMEIQYAGMCGAEDTALIWYVSGNPSQGYTYIPVECEVVGEAEYRYVQLFPPIEGENDIAVLQWKNGCAFCIHNQNCKTIRIMDHSGTHDEVIGKDAYPYVFYHESWPCEYLFLDWEGNLIS